MTKLFLFSSAHLSELPDSGWFVIEGTMLEKLGTSVVEDYVFPAHLSKLPDLGWFDQSLMLEILGTTFVEDYVPKFGMH